MAIGESSKAAQERNGKKFPVGMRVVAIDDDPICLAMLKKYLTKCQYQVTCFTNAVEALKMIKENKHHIDLVITDVHMPNFDGFQLLEIAGLQLDLPVIMLSADDTKETVMKGIMHGACDYLVKPIRLEELRVIWKHVATRQPHEEFDGDVGDNQTSDGEDDTERRPRDTHGGHNASSNTGKRRIMSSDDMESDDKAAKKKQRLVWTQDLHRTFVDAVSEIGVDKAVPKRVLEKMSMDDLTRENVASHLQKYRQYLKRMNSTTGFQAGFSPGSSFSIDLGSCERFKNFHTHGRYKKTSCNNSSPVKSKVKATRRNRTSTNTPNSADPNLSSSSQMTQIGGGTGFNNAGPSTDTSTNNTMNNNQMNQYRGFSGASSFPGTLNSTYLTQFSNNPNFPPMYYPAWGPVPFAPFGYPMTNVPPISNPNSMVGPLFGARPSLQFGGNFNSGTGVGLQQSVSSFNTSWSIPNPGISITINPNNIYCGNFGTFFNNRANAHSVITDDIGTGTRSNGIEAGNVSSGMESDIGTGGIGPDIVSNGMRTSPMSGNRTGVVSNIGTYNMSGGIGMGIVSGGMGTGTGNVSGSMGTTNVSSGMATGIVNGGMETGPVSGGTGTDIASGTEVGPLDGAMETGIVSGMEILHITEGGNEFSMTSFGRADSIGDNSISSSYHDIDDVSISGLDELLSSMRTTDGGDGAGSLPFMDDDVFN